MALKDLTVTKSELTEKQVEEIVAEYVRYDPAAKEIVFLPAAASLSNRSKTLIYLVALHGWPFVSEDKIPTEATPAQMEQALHIPGGTLRPILKDLKDSHFTSARGRVYSVKSSALTHIKTEITGTTSRASSIHRSKRTKPKDSAARAEHPVASGAHHNKRSKRGVGLSELFDSLLTKNFFSKPRTVGDVKDEFHKHGHIVPLTSVPKYLLKAILTKKLQREKKEVNAKKVWVYETAK